MNKGVANGISKFVGRLIRSELKRITLSRCEELKERFGGILGTIIDTPMNRIQVVAAATPRSQSAV